MFSLLEALVVREDLHGWLGVRVGGGLEFQLFDPQLLEEFVEHPDEVAQAEVPVGDDALDLVELCQVGGVQRLVAEDAVDGEVLLRLKFALAGQLVQHAG